MLSPEVISLITASLLVSGVVILILKSRPRRPRRAQSGATPFYRQDDDSEIHSNYESDSALSSLENLELVSENQHPILLSATMTGFLPTVVRKSPVVVKEVEDTEEEEVFDSFGDDICDELEELVIELESEETDEMIAEEEVPMEEETAAELPAETVEEEVIAEEIFVAELPTETVEAIEEIDPATVANEEEMVAELELITEVPAETVEAIEAETTFEEEKEEVVESLPEEEIVSEEIIVSEEPMEAPAITAEEEEANLMADISATADAIDTEIAALAASDEDVRRATLRRAPRRQRRIVRAVDENIDTQISELDQRLDALEALVVSIEMGLAEFEPLLEDVDAEAARAAAATTSEVANNGDQAQAA
ncbi:MAG: hypothetical protein KDN20_04020 [Verrucomicrobiae bacterium]|nr:hypothetical protein [Verrucomicrobiae bacterium]